MDEVGRGAIAGPVVVGAAVSSRASDEPPAGLKDSKLLSAKRREELAPLAASWSRFWSVGEASVEEIEAHGIVAALALAGSRALAQLADLGVPLNRCVVLLDGSHNWLGRAQPQPARVITQTKADRDCTVVAAASVIAKVERDRTMQLAAVATPQYGWDGNKGYGSAGHFAAIAEHGLHRLHRTSWVKLPQMDA